MICLQAGTDKVTTHNYQTLYTKYFESETRPPVNKLFEIGFGCHLKGKGHAKAGKRGGRGVKLWRRYFPAAEIWSAEYVSSCPNVFAKMLAELNVSMVTGDQSNASTLMTWVNITKGNFDVIIDDGGHSNENIYNAFNILFQKALKPGGLYVIEDIQASILKLKNGTEHAFINVLKDWMEQLLTFSVQGARPAYIAKHKLPPRIKSIDVFAESCAIVKCYENDISCSYGQYEDAALTLWP